MTDITEAVRAALAVANEKTKRELVPIARRMGWQGDEARTSKDELAAYVAQHAAHDDTGALFAHSDHQDQEAAPMPRKGAQAPDITDAARMFAEAIAAAKASTVDADEVRDIVARMLDEQAATMRHEAAQAAEAAAAAAVAAMPARSIESATPRA